MQSDKTWCVPDGVFPGDREHSDETAKHLYNFVIYHRQKTDIISGELSLPLPERFFNESGYPEYEFVTNWILTCTSCSNAYLSALRECIVIIIDFISSSKGNIKENGLYKYLTECQREKSFVKAELSRLKGDAIQEKEMRNILNKVQTLKK